MSLFKNKVAKSDYTVDMLPQNRKEIFKDVSYLHRAKFFIYGFYFVLFSLPLLVIQILKDYLEMGILSTITDSSTVEDIASKVVLAYNYDNLLAIFDIVGFIILGIGIAGLSRVIRDYAFEENVNFKICYVKGIKQNTSAYILLALLFGLLRFICIYLINNSLLTSKQELSFYLGFIPIVILPFTILPALMYVFSGIPIYNMKFTKRLKMGLYVYSKNILNTLKYMLIFLLAFVLELLPIALGSFVLYLHIIGRIIACFLLPFIILKWFLVSYDVFDEYINKYEHKELVGKGIFKKKEGENNG